MKRLLLAASLLLPTAACDSGGGYKIPGKRDLKPGGVYIAYNNKCKQGCDQIEKGDLIQKIDGKAVASGDDFDAANVTDGKPHKLELLSWKKHEAKTVDLVATVKTNMPPIKEVPPFWTVGAEALNKTPEWARRRMYGHASPMVQLVSSDGGILDGRQLHGKKRFIVYWDWQMRPEQAAAVTFLKVLQKAQSDLQAKGVDVLFTHLTFPSGAGGTTQRKAAANDSDLRAFQKKWGETRADGSPFPPIPMYRFPNSTEYNQARELGLEGAYTVIENLGESPAIVLLDERGIIRWHSEGVQEPTAGSEVSDATQFTIISAVEFSLKDL